VVVVFDFRKPELVWYNQRFDSGIIFLKKNCNIVVNNQEKLFYLCNNWKFTAMKKSSKTAKKDSNVKKSKTSGSEDLKKVSTLKPMKAKEKKAWKNELIEEDDEDLEEEVENEKESEDYGEFDEKEPSKFEDFSVGNDDDDEEDDGYYEDSF
jgi:hypothetical protein